MDVYTRDTAGRCDPYGGAVIPAMCTDWIPTSSITLPGLVQPVLPCLRASGFCSSSGQTFPSPPVSLTPTRTLYLHSH